MSISPLPYSSHSADVELGLPIPTSTHTKDNRHKNQHWREDPHFIAEYLAQNTSKAAAVFRRYDKLAMFSII